MIIEIGETLVSDEIFTKKFICDLNKCKGACCIEGDRGAPISLAEIETIDSNIEKIIPFMTERGLKLLQEEGFHEGTEIDDPATTCLDSGECVFVYKENNILGCAIEKAHLVGEIDFYKPISCHLYPIRLGKVGSKETINYHEWSICSDACKFGKTMNIPMFKFLKTPLVRNYGDDWFKELELVYEEYSNQFPDKI
jgi:hypothetical protein